MLRLWPSVMLVSTLSTAIAQPSTRPITDEIDVHNVRKWVVAYGDNLVNLAKYITAYDEFVNEFNSSTGIKLDRANNVELIQNISNQLADMFGEKRKALQNLVKKAEAARANFTDLESVDAESKELQYWNAKFLTTDPPEANATNSTNTTETSLSGKDGKQQQQRSVSSLFRSGGNKLASHGKGEHDDEAGKIADRPKVPYLVTRQSCHFDNMYVNTSLSTVHIPTNIYDGDAEIVSEAKWSESLDAVFRENFMHDPSLKWQYFGSQSGLFRVFPGVKWPKKWNEDFYDCRTQYWYIKTAASPKDLVILVDNSGSMTGLRWQIAKKTIEGILNSLTADDFFAVVPFQAAPMVISNCGNDSLLQATAENKQFIKKELRSDKYQPKDIAVYPTALEFAFKLLRFNDSKSLTDRSCDCNKAIMVISDGAPPGTEEVFAKYNKNSEKKIRVFSYLIGREVSDATEVRDMACNNAGYYVHISTLADVAEYVQEYIHVLSRPMVINRYRPTIYTDIYIDPIRFPRGPLSHEEYMNDRLLITVAQPVYDLRSSTEKQGIFLGVMGTDVPISDLRKHAPAWKLGPNAYFMIVTNNGHVVTHPMFRPKIFQDQIGMQRLPDYTDLFTDIAEIELAITANKNSSDLLANYSLGLRSSLIRAESQEFNQTIVGTYDSTNKRVFVRANRYRVVNIDSVPYGLGIAMPQQYGYYMLDAKMRFFETPAKIMRGIMDTSGEIQQYLTPYEFCYTKGEELNLSDSIGFILGPLKALRNDPRLVCNMDYVDNVLFDANATRRSEKHWNKTLPNDLIDFVFIATRTGLIRYKLPQDTNVTVVHSFWPQIISSNKTAETTYYRRTVENTASHSAAKDTDGTCETCFSSGRLTVTVETRPLVYDEDLVTELELNLTQSTPSPDARQHKLRAAHPTPVQAPVSGHVGQKRVLKNAQAVNDTNGTAGATAKPRSDERLKALFTLTIPVERSGAIPISAPIAVVGTQISIETMQNLAENTRAAPCSVLGNWTSVQPFRQPCAPPKRRGSGGMAKSVQQQNAETDESLLLKSLCDGYNNVCFVLDENGFVVFSRHIRTELYAADVYTGRFFGEIKGHYWIISELVDRGVYRRVEFVDYQAVCQRGIDQKSDASSIMWKPFGWVMAAFQRAIANFIVMMIEADFEWLYNSAVDAAQEFVRAVRDESSAGGATDPVAGIDDVEEGIAGDAEGGSEEAGEDHSGELGSSSTRFSKVKESCIEHMSLYYYSESWKKNDNKIANGTDFIAAKIPRTNLVLVILRSQRTMLQANANCTVNYNSPGCLAPISPPPAIPKSESCYQPFRETPRDVCHKYSTDEDSKRCTMSGAPVCRASLLSLLSVFYVFSLICRRFVVANL